MSSNQRAAAQWALAVGALGVVFGDIGTSPLYTVQTVFNPGDPHPVRLLALSRKTRLSGSALVEIGLDVGLSQRNSRWAAVDHAADRHPVALAKRSDPKKMTEGIE